MLINRLCESNVVLVVLCARVTSDLARADFGAACWAHSHVFDQTFVAQIKSGLVAPLPAMYSKELKALVAAMLQTTASKRPSAGVILQSPLIRDRIDKFLSETYRCPGLPCKFEIV